jgi:GT2 family glycosyltransferase
MTHKSVGATNQQWEDNRKLFIELYNEHLPCNAETEIFYDNEYPKKLKSTPHVGVIIPTKGNIDLLTQCVNSIFEKDKYPHLTVYIADTGSIDEEKEQIRELIGRHSICSDRPRTIKLIEYDYYNFARINNDVVWNHVDERVELLLFCNNDIKLINNAITKMVSVMVNNKSVGTVGARLHFGDDSIQHSGVIAFVGSNDRRIHLSHKGLRSNYNYHTQTREVLGNTAAFMLIKKEIFNKIGGFNQGYKECFEDVELNIDCLNRNLKNYFVSEAVCYHYESQTRNKDPEKLQRESEDYVNRIIPYILDSERS